MNNEITLDDCTFRRENTIDGDTLHTIHSLDRMYAVHILNLESPVKTIKLYKGLAHSHVPMPVSVLRAVLDVIKVNPFDVDLALQEDGSYVVSERPQRFATKVAAYFFTDFTVYHLDDWNGERMVVNMGKGDGQWTLQRFVQHNSVRVTQKDVRDVLRHLCLDVESYDMWFSVDKLTAKGEIK